jgi:hypothetical protein
MTGTASMFAKCPLAGCSNLTDDPRHPCSDCLTQFGPLIRQRNGDSISADEFTAAATVADARVRTILADRAQLVPLPGTEPVGEPEPPLEAKRSQMCWVCEQRRSCVPDQAHPDRMICRDCSAVPL